MSEKKKTFKPRLKPKNGLFNKLKYLKPLSTSNVHLCNIEK